jgi:hypothetical protein
MEVMVACLAFTLVVQDSPSVAQGGRISGVVIEEGTNLPVAGARVMVVPAEASPSPPTDPPEALTDAEGRFVFSNLPPGRFRLGAHKETFAVPVNEAILPIVDLAAGGDVDRVNVPMQRGAVIVGSVLAPSGEPIANAAVTAMLKRLDIIGGVREAPPPDAAVGPPILMPLGGATTDARGEFRIDGLPAGDYIVAADPASDFRDAGATGSLTAGTTYYPGTTDEAAADVVGVQTGQTTAHIVVRLAIAPTYRVSGVIVDEAGMPVENGAVMLMPDMRNDPSLASLMTGTHRSIRADANGVFVMTGIPAGAYTIESADGGGIGAVATSRSVVIDAAGQPVAGKDRTDAPLAPGAAAIVITDSDVSDLRIIVRKQ